MSASTKAEIKIPEFLQKKVVLPVVELPKINPPVEVVDNEGSIKTKCSSGRCNMSTMEREAFICKIKGMTDEQIDIMLDVVPIGLIYDRLGRELAKNQDIIHSLQNTMSLVDTNRMS